MSKDARAELEALEAHFNDEKEIMLAEADDIALEINVIKRRLAQETLLAACEIGRLLHRAKDKVPHGMWGEWLEENVAYSQSTANNLMRLYREYGEREQLDFFAENRMEIFGNLSQSQAVALLSVPYEKRKEFVETHDMEKTSVRDIEAELAAAKADLEAAYAERDKMGDELFDTKKKLAETDAAREDAVMRALAAESGGELGALRSEVFNLKEANSKASKEWLAERKELESQLEEMKKKAETAQISIDSEVSEEKRAEIEKAVSDKYEAELARLRKEANKPPVVMNEKAIEVNILFGDLQEIYARIVSLLDGVDREDPALGKKLRTAIKAALGQMMEGKA